MATTTSSPISEYGMYRQLTTGGMRDADSFGRGETLPPERAHSIALMIGEGGNHHGDGGNVLDARGAAHRREIAAMQLYQVIITSAVYAEPILAAQLPLTRCFGGDS